MKDTVLEVGQKDYLISTDPSRLDVAAIHSFLTRSYWCPGVPLETVAESVRRSLCFGVYHHGQQVGLARVITDGATFAYLCDVYVLEEHRGLGLGKSLMEVVMSHPSLQRLRRFALVTRDGHGLYERFGFRPLRRPEGYMEIHRPDIYAMTGD